MKNTQACLCSLLAIAICGASLAGAGRPGKGWVRKGELGSKPRRITEDYPLSDQGNEGDWVKYEVMSDEFSGAELDSEKWWPKNPRWLGRQPALFYPGNVTVSDGKLHLAMRKQEVPKMPRDKGYHTYTSAAVQSKSLVKYGYFEIRCRPMKSNGSSSFWFYNNEPRLWTEIDVFEIGGGAPGFEKKYNMNVHVFKTPTEKEHWSRHGAWAAPSKLADDFHTYGLEWDRDVLKWYFDGVLVRRIENTHRHQPLTLNFDSETMPDWFGLPRDSDLPSTYSIEYVRAWKKSNRGSFVQESTGVTHEIRPATVDTNEEFERIANSLKPGDELILHGGTYSQNSRRAVSVSGTADRPIVIRAADGEDPLLARPPDNRDRHNNIEFVDCSHLVIRGLRFRGGSSGVRFIRGHHITFEDCEVAETGNNALTMNSGDCDSFIIRRNHIHHTGLSTSGQTEGEGMYIGCHNGSCVTTNTLVEGNYIHHTRGTSSGGNDGIEIKFGSYGNIVRDNVLHDTNVGRQYPGIFVYGSGGKGINIVEGNVIWNAGEGIQVVSDAIIRNNIIFNCSMTGITAAPHTAVRQVRNTRIVNNTIVNSPKGILIRWGKATDMILANNAIYCPGATAVDVSGIGNGTFSANFVEGLLHGATVDGSRFHEGDGLVDAFVDPGRNNFWPRQGAVLSGSANPVLAAELDFNAASREAPFDVGAYESERRTKNPGWRIRAGFKHTARP